jgi:hypothetical protein
METSPQDFDLFKSLLPFEWCIIAGQRNWFRAHCSRHPDFAKACGASVEPSFQTSSPEWVKTLQKVGGHDLVTLHKQKLGPQSCVKDLHVIGSDNRWRFWIWNTPVGSVSVSNYGGILFEPDDPAAWEDYRARMTAPPPVEVNRPFDLNLYPVRLGTHSRFRSRKGTGPL